MNKNPVVESEKTIPKEVLDKINAVAVGYGYAKDIYIKGAEKGYLFAQSEIQKLRSLLKGLLFQYDASGGCEWDEVKAVREYLKENG